MVAPKREPLNQTDHIRNDRYEVDSYRMSYTVIYGEIAAPGFEPVRRKTLNRVGRISHVGALAHDVHDTALRNVPCWKTRPFGTKTEVRLLEIQKVIFVHASDGSQNRRPNQH